MLASSILAQDPGVGVKPMAGADVTSAEAASAAVVFAVAGASDSRQHFGKH